MTGNSQVGNPQTGFPNTTPWTLGNASLNANLIAGLNASQRRRWIELHDLTTAQTLVTDWAFWANDAQHPPAGHWATWLFLGGRGAGKTRAGAQWVQSSIARGQRIALVGPSLHDVREVMIEGPSGLRAIASTGGRPHYEVSRRRLRWPNGAVAYAFSAEDPESLRGPQFHLAWADEFCAWRQPSETLALLRMGLRLGAPRLCVTTTPKPISALKVLMSETGTVMTRSSTAENAENLSEAFVETLM